MTKTTEKPEGFLTLSDDGYLSMSIPLHIRNGEFMAYGALERARQMVERHFIELRQEQRRQNENTGLIKPNAAN